MKSRSFFACHPKMTPSTNASGILERVSSRNRSATVHNHRGPSTYYLRGADGVGWLNFAASIATFVSAEVSSTSDRPSVHVVMT
jgi:hypothetical protein